MPPQVHAIASQHETDEQQPQSQEERNDNESPSALTEELRRQVSEMQIEMQQQAARHEKERLQWKEERQRLTILLRQQRTTDKTVVSPRAAPQSSQPKQSLSLLIDKNEGTREIQQTKDDSQSDTDDKLTSNCATETTMQNPEAADQIRNHTVPVTSSSCSGMQTTGSGLPQATKILPSQAKSDSSVHISSHPEISESSLETTGKADRNIITRFIRLSPLLPKENSAFNDILISREDKLLKRITERRLFGQNCNRADRNRKRRITPMLLSKSRVFKDAPNTPDEYFLRESKISAMGQQRVVDQLPHFFVLKTSEVRVSKQLNPSVSDLIQNFEAFRDSKNQAGMGSFSQTLSPEGKTDSIQGGYNPIVKQSRFDRLNNWQERLVKLEKQKESQLPPSRGQVEPIRQVAANYYSTYKSSPDCSCKVNVGNDAIEKLILPTTRQAENPRIQEHKRYTDEEEELRKLDYENANEHGDTTMNCQVNCSPLKTCNVVQWNSKKYNII